MSLTLGAVCSHVNKKALDQYTNFTEQREELARRQTENGRGEDKIKQLIQTLDMRKDEAIERTFKVIPLQNLHLCPTSDLLAPTNPPLLYPPSAPAAALALTISVACLSSCLLT